MSRGRDSVAAEIRVTAQQPFFATATLQFGLHYSLGPEKAKQLGGAPQHTCVVAWADRLLKSSSWGVRKNWTTRSTAAAALGWIGRSWKVNLCRLALQVLCTNP